MPGHCRIIIGIGGGIISIPIGLVVKYVTPHDPGSQLTHVSRTQVLGWRCAGADFPDRAYTVVHGVISAGGALAAPVQRFNRHLVIHAGATGSRYRQLSSHNHPWHKQDNEQWSNDIPSLSMSGLYYLASQSNTPAP